MHTYTDTHIHTQNTHILIHTFSLSPSLPLSLFIADNAILSLPFSIALSPLFSFLSPCPSSRRLRCVFARIFNLSWKERGPERKDEADREIVEPIADLLHLSLYLSFFSPSPFSLSPSLSSRLLFSSIPVSTLLTSGPIHLFRAETVNRVTVSFSFPFSLSFFLSSLFPSPSLPDPPHTPNPRSPASQSPTLARAAGG